MTEMDLHHAIRDLTTNIPAEILNGVADALLAGEPAGWSKRRGAVLGAVAEPALRHRLVTFLSVWEENHPQTGAPAVALALRTAGAVADHFHQSQKLELVWTGPETGVIPLRRSEQVLLEVIATAETELHVVSFAVYQLPEMQKALIAAADRGVALNLYLETPESSGGKVTYDPIPLLGPAVVERATVYVWPLAQRMQSGSGQVGSLHAKLALADRKALFISSANLTGYAMTINMELGILLTGGKLPKTVHAHLAALVSEGLFVPIESQGG